MVQPPLGDLQDKTILLIHSGIHCVHLEQHNVSIQNNKLVNKYYKKVRCGIQVIFKCYVITQIKISEIAIEKI